MYLSLSSHQDFDGWPLENASDGRGQGGRLLSSLGSGHFLMEPRVPFGPENGFSDELSLCLLERSLQAPSLAG